MALQSFEKLSWKRRILLLTLDELVDYVDRPSADFRTAAVSHDAVLDCHLLGSADSDFSARGTFSSPTCKAFCEFAVQEARFSFHADSGLLTLCSTRGRNRLSQSQQQRMLYFPCQESASRNCEDRPELVDQVEELAPGWCCRKRRIYWLSPRASTNRWAHEWQGLKSLFGLDEGCRGDLQCVWRDFRRRKAQPKIERSYWF